MPENNNIVVHRPDGEHPFNLAMFKRLALAQPHWVIDTETNGLEVLGHRAKHRAFWIGLMPKGSRHVFIFTREEFEDWDLRPIVEELRLIGHNLRFDLHALNLRPHIGWTDTIAASYYRNTTTRHSMDHIAKVHGWPKIPTPDALKQGRIQDVPEEELILYLADDCLTTNLMADTFFTVPCEEDYHVEAAVYRMERRGVRLLYDRLKDVGNTLIRRIMSSEVKLRQEGMIGNLNSSAQVAEWLTGMGRRLPYTPTGKPSTAKTALQKLSDDGDELAALLIDWRKLIKLKTSFIEPLPNLAQDGMLYPRTNTTRTATGRFSCDTPNLQQIPKRGPLGKAIRSCLTSGDEDGVTACDFSQVELRVAAAFANEPVLLEAFNTGNCPHTEVAAKMLGKLTSEISPDERFKAKAVNFGILNGMGAKRLALELKTNKAEANRFLGEYRKNLPQLYSWMEGVWREAETYNLARTVAGRTRIFHGYEDTRPAISVIVQGSAAELMRKALVAVDHAGLNPILSVHDEILIGGTDNPEYLKEVMEDAANSAYPDAFSEIKFPATATTGETWGDV